VRKREIYLAHTIQVTIPDDGHLHDVKLSTTIMWMMQTHVETGNVEVLVELTEIGTTKEFRIHGESKRKERDVTRIAGTQNRTCRLRRLCQRVWCELLSVQA